MSAKTRVEIIDNMNDSQLAHILDENYKYAMADRQDWMTVVSGYVGAGKSQMGTWMGLRLNPEFDPNTQVIYDADSQFKFYDLYEKKPGVVGLYDEACLYFMGEDASTKLAKGMKKISITHRDLGFYNIFCSPSPWLLAPFIRKFRVRDFVYVYVDGYSNNHEEENKFPRNYAYYTKKDYTALINNAKSMPYITIPDVFLKMNPPSIHERFPKPTGKKIQAIFDRTFELKKESQRKLRDQIRGMKEQEGEDDYNKSAVQMVNANKVDIAMRLWKVKGWTCAEASQFCKVARESVSRAFNSIDNIPDKSKKSDVA